MNVKQVLEIFVEHGMVDPAQVDELAQEIAQTGKTLVQTLVDYQFLTEEQFYQTIAESLATEAADLRGFEPPSELLRLIPFGLAQFQHAFPVRCPDGSIQL